MGRRVGVTVAPAAPECQQNDNTAARPCAKSPALKLNLKRENIADRLFKPHNQRHALSGGLIVELRNLCVYCGSSDAVAPHFLEAAFSLGRLIGLAGLGLIYGGGRGGLMGRVADGVLIEGGRVTGIIPQHLSCREVAHGALTELIVVNSMHERKQRMAELADAFIILPGGFGTLDEMFEIITWRQLGLHDKPILLVDLDGFWQPLERLIDHVTGHGFVSKGNRSLYQRVEQIDEVLPALTAALPPLLPLVGDLL
jgi:uncharacterized protein (TIGR00730 family)